MHTLRDALKEKIINIIKIKGCTLRDALRDGLFGGRFSCTQNDIYVQRIRGRRACRVRADAAAARFGRPGMTGARGRRRLARKRATRGDAWTGQRRRPPSLPRGGRSTGDAGTPSPPGASARRRPPIAPTAATARRCLGEGGGRRPPFRGQGDLQGNG